MKAVFAENKQPVVKDAPPPTPATDELLVAVKSTAINRADLMQVAGSYPPPPGAPEVLGLEFAGEVVEVGANVDTFSVGDRVMALVAGGSYAEQAIVKSSHAMPVPDTLDIIDAGAVPEAFLTAYSNMVEIGGLSAGETVLIHAGASGVGLAAVQLAKAIGATVIVTASAPKHDICLEYGADVCIDYKTQNFADVILEERDGVDLVVEMVGAPYWDDNVRVLKKWGRLVFIGLLGGAVKEVNFGEIMGKRLTVSGATLRNRTDERKTALIANFWQFAEARFVSGELRPTVWKTLPLDEVAQAHQLMRESANAGKIVLTV